MKDAGQVPLRPHTAGKGEDRAQRASSYDPRRAQARLALIEQQVRLASAAKERQEILGCVGPSIDPEDPLEIARIKAERAICDAERWVTELNPLVGIPIPWSMKRAGCRLKGVSDSCGSSPPSPARKPTACVSGCLLGAPN
jgi:hypothetical protein